MTVVALAVEDFARVVWVADAYGAEKRRLFVYGATEHFPGERECHGCAGRCSS